ncbi:MAG: anthranilate synthase component I family protein [Planctomycetales bacterium]|nr:anthranilate synthase component I family protein [Planctomycetales bacterium]
MPCPAPPDTLASVVVELPDSLDAVAALLRLQSLPGCVLFDSAMRHSELGRYSYVAADPFEWLTCDRRQDGFQQVADALKKCPANTLNGLPPFQGGAAGVFGYELCHALESLPEPRVNEFQLPAMAVGLYDVVLAFDHFAGRGWLVSQGLPAQDDHQRRTRAEARAQQFLRLLDSDPSPACSAKTSDCQTIVPNACCELPGRPGVVSDFSRDEYLHAVARAIDYIHAGDVFQVNLSQRLLARLTEPAIEYYLRLRETSPAPFGGYFDAGAFTLCSASPERFLRCDNRRVETRPIKGTRPRSADPQQDFRWAEELLRSEKDRAENTMIVDLVRNDLSRVCTDESVIVPTLCGLESYEQVHHLVSVVRGLLREGQSPVDLLRVAFPGGSVTGAPKVRAMEIIAELEPTTRGPYCGSLAYIGFDGAMDSSILIRTAIAAGGWLQMPAGGGVVADSDPANEYEETLHKAAGMLAALDPR